MLKLDKKDQILLYELSRNARATHTQLGKKIQLSKSSVKYRIERLKELKLIEKFTTVVNIGAFGSDTAVILIRFNNEMTKEIKEYFRNLKETNWAITLSGHWDLLVEVVFTTLFDLQGTIKNILQNFSGILGDYEIMISSKAIRVEHLVKDFYKDLEIKPIEQKHRATPNSITLDDTDRKILKTLTQNSEQNIIDIANKVNKSLDTVKTRMKNLSENGVIIKYFVEINLKKLGYLEYLYKIKLTNLDLKKISDLTNSIKSNDNIKYAFIDMTSTNIIIHFAFKDSEEIDRFASELRKDYHDIIQSQDYYLIKEQIQFNLFPEIIAN